MDIRTGVMIVAALSAVLGFFVLRAAVQAMQSARKYSFYKAHKQRNAAALRLFVFSLMFFACAIGMPVLGESLASWYSPPSPTPSLRPTAAPFTMNTFTPASTETPAPMENPLETWTPTTTVTPFIPIAVEALFEGVVTPNSESVFTEIQFSTKFDGVNPIDPKSSFRLPIDTMYGGFDYNNTIPGVQWTALWYRDGNLIFYETRPWNGGTGGIGGYTECSNPLGGWLPGNYEVQIFMGYELKKIGRFVVLSDATPKP